MADPCTRPEGQVPVGVDVALPVVVEVKAHTLYCRPSTGILTLGLSGGTRVDGTSEGKLVRELGEGVLADVTFMW